MISYSLICEGGGKKRGAAGEKFAQHPPLLSGAAKSHIAKLEIKTNSTSLTRVKLSCTTSATLGSSQTEGIEGSREFPFALTNGIKRKSGF